MASQLFFVGGAAWGKFRARSVPLSVVGPLLSRISSLAPRSNHTSQIILWAICGITGQYGAGTARISQHTFSYKLARPQEMQLILTRPNPGLDGELQQQMILLSSGVKPWRCLVLRSSRPADGWALRVALDVVPMPKPG